MFLFLHWDMASSHGRKMRWPGIPSGKDSVLLDASSGHGLSPGVRVCTVCQLPSSKDMATVPCMMYRGRLLSQLLRVCVLCLFTCVFFILFLLLPRPHLLDLIHNQRAVALSTLQNLLLPLRPLHLPILILITHP